MCGRIQPGPGAALAQLVEHPLRKRQVICSNQISGTIPSPLFLFSCKRMLASRRAGFETGSPMVDFAPLVGLS